MLAAAISVSSLQARHVRARFECPGTLPSQRPRNRPDKVTSLTTYFQATVTDNLSANSLTSFRRMKWDGF